MTAPRSRRERPAKPALTREGIVATAVGLMRAEGLERVTMRRLATELDTGPASLYVYVRNTAELHAAVLDELLGTVELRPRKGNWQDRLVRILASYTDVLFKHPGLAQSALVARPSGPNYLNLVEAILAVLAEGGVPPGQAAWGLDLLLLTATASAAEHQTEASQEDWDLVAAAVLGAKKATHPNIAALGTELLSGTGPERLAWAVRVLINGTRTTPRESS
jgi:AcrR family transcriptional regulator